MSIGHLLETFDAIEVMGSNASRDEESIADRDLEIFERGYKAGWDDGHEAQLQAAAALREDFAQNLRDMSFTYHEAYAAVLKSLEPLVLGLFEALLPDIAHEALARRLSAEVEKAARNCAGSTIEICCQKDECAFIEESLPQDTGIDLCVREAPELKAGQVRLRFGEREIEFDTPAFLSELSEMARNSFIQIAEDQKHG